MYWGSPTPVADVVGAAAAVAVSIISKDNGTSGGTSRRASRQSCHLDGFKGARQRERVKRKEFISKLDQQASRILSHASKLIKKKVLSLTYWP